MTFKSLILVFTSSFLLYNVASAQDDSLYIDSMIMSDDWKEMGISAGINNATYLYGEVGFYHGYVYRMGALPVFSYAMNYGFEFSYFDDFILAPKVQARAHIFLLDLSLSALYYTNFDDKHSIKLRPEIGFGVHNIDICYGYNINLYNDNFNRSNTHMLTISCYLQLSQKYLQEYNSDGVLIER